MSGNAMLVDAGTLCPRLPATLGHDLAWEALTALSYERGVPLIELPDLDARFLRFDGIYDKLAKRSGWLGYMSGLLLTQLLDSGHVALTGKTDRDLALAELAERTRAVMLETVGTLATQLEHVPTDEMWFDEHFADRRQLEFVFDD